MSVQYLSPALLFGLAACGEAQPVAPKVEHHGTHAAPTASDSAATRGYKASMDSMMRGPAYTGDADHDFMLQMRIHHVAAVEMARVELAHGMNSEARALASAIIEAQQAEIAQIDRWLEGNRSTVPLAAGTSVPDRAAARAGAMRSGQ